MLAAVVPSIRPLAQDLGDSPLAKLLHGLERLLGSNPENALLGLLAMAFMVTYMIAAPLFGWLAEAAGCLPHLRRPIRTRRAASSSAS